MCAVWGRRRITPSLSLAATATIERHALCMPDHVGMPDQVGKHWAWWQIKQQNWKPTGLSLFWTRIWAKGFTAIGPCGTDRCPQAQDIRQPPRPERRCAMRVGIQKAGSRRQGSESPTPARRKAAIPAYRGGPDPLRSLSQRKASTRAPAARPRPPGVRLSVRLSVGWLWSGRGFRPPLFVQSGAVRTYAST